MTFHVLYLTSAFLTPSLNREDRCLSRYLSSLRGGFGLTRYTMPSPPPTSPFIFMAQDEYIRAYCPSCFTGEEVQFEYIGMTIDTAKNVLHYYNCSTCGGTFAESTVRRYKEAIDRLGGIEKLVGDDE